MALRLQESSRCRAIDTSTHGNDNLFSNSSHRFSLVDTIVPLIIIK